MRFFPLFIVAWLLSSLAPTFSWAQRLDCKPCSHSFGVVRIDKSRSFAIKLSNPGSKALRITSTPITYTVKRGGEFSLGDFLMPNEIRPGETIELPIVFKPTARGYTSGVIKLVSTAENSSLPIDVEGTGSYPVLEVSPGTLDFGSVGVGSTASMQATLSAPDAAVTVSSTQSSSSEFAILGLSLPVTIPAGQSLPVTIQFTPSATGAASGQAGFVSNAISYLTLEDLTGTGVASATPQLSISPATLSFGSVNVGASASLQATLAASNAAVTITSDPSNNSAFSVTGLSLPVTIQAGNSLPVTIQFKPSASGKVSTQTKFVSNASGSPTIEKLTGTGVASATPQLSVSPATLNFGNVTVGSSATLQASLTASNAAVTITSDPSNSSEFSVTGLSLPVTIQAGNSLPVTLQFTPNASGTASAQAGFISNASGSPTVEQLAGTGVAQSSYYVSLSWDAGATGIMGYNVYRATAESGPFEMINTALDASANYTDSTVVSGSTYYYAATEVNAQGQESSYSNVGVATIP